MNQKKIDLLQEAGEFCTERHHPALPRLREEIGRALETREPILICRTGVKMMTTSFIDELLTELAREHSLDLIQASVRFEPELEDFYWQQVKRGLRLRQ